MRIKNRIQIALARGVLSILVLIHVILPFTAVNPHPQLRIKIGSLVLAALFFGIALYSISRPLQALISGFTLLLAVYVVSALTGASPITEGLQVKIAFVLLLSLGIMAAYTDEHAIR